MKGKLALLISVALNLVLLGGVIFLIQPRSPRATRPVAINTVAVSRPSAPGSKLPLGSTPLPDATPPPAPIDWRQVESEDYRRYLANLRAIGCPEKTIRDIIKADVNDLFSSRMAAVTRTNQYEYWRRNPVARTDDQEQQLRDLCAQKQELLKTLGVDTPDFTDLVGEAFRDKITETDRQLEFLPASKRQQVKEALFSHTEQEVVNRRLIDEQETRTRIESVLTPEEFREYELRCSRDAEKLRGVIDDLAPTEQEFRAIFDAWRNLKTIDAGTPQFREAQASTEAALRQLLGPARFEQYLKDAAQLGN